MGFNDEVWTHHPLIQSLTLFPQYQKKGSNWMQEKHTIDRLYKAMNCYFDKI